MALRSCIRTAFLLLAFLVSLFALYIAVPFWNLASKDCCWSSTIPNATANFQWTPTSGRPLNALFMTWGSRGDHQPNIALGLELARRGVNVTVMGHIKYRHLIEQHKHDLFHYAVHTDTHIWLLGELMAQGQGTDFLPLTVDYITNSSHELVDQYLQVARDCNADILFGSHSAMLMLHHVTVAQALQKPLFFLTHDLTLPTRYQSFDLQENRVRDYGSVANMLGHRIFSIVMGAALTIQPNSKWRRLRSDLGLSTPWPFWELLHPSVLAEFPVLSTADMTLWPRPKDHPPHWYATGYFVTRSKSSGGTGEENEQATEQLVQWIQERQSLHGRPLLYFGQGSFDHHERQVATDVLLDALDKLQMDAITLKSTVDERVGSTLAVDHVRVVDQLDQEVVFPLCSVVSHHGGAGTASQVVRSGRPGLCIPSMPFQQIWGGRLEEYGAGVMLLPKDMEAAWEANRTNLLVGAIQQALQEEVAATAKELRKLTLAIPDGVQVGAGAVLYHVQQIVTHHQEQISRHESKQEL